MAEQEIVTVTISPSRVTRVQEKQELAGLNDRLIQYIEKVRSLKERNLHLEIELTSTKDQLGKESEAVKLLYESELKDARALVDETAKEKARQQILASKNSVRVGELEEEIKELKDTIAQLEARLSAAEREAASSDSQRKTLLSDRAKLQKQVKELEAELAELKNRYESMKADLERETLIKVDLQNNIQSLKEEMEFRQKVYEEELSSLREKLSLRVSGHIDTEMQAVIDSRLEILIDDLRERSDIDIADYKLQIEAVYKDKISALEKQTSRDATTINKLNMELRNITSSKHDYSGEISKLQKAIEALEKKLRDKDDDISRLRRYHADEMSTRLEELRTTRENYEIKIKEYEELMDIKVQLDQEIATYRALLQEEETRLNLTPTPREKRTRTRVSTTITESAPKKPRLDTSHTQEHKIQSSCSAGRVQVTEVDSEGRFITIQNMTAETEAIGGWKITHEVEGGSSMTFRFHHMSRLQGGASVTVWSDNAEGATHNPPSDIIWRKRAWGSGNKTVTRIIKGEEELHTFNQSIERSPCKQHDDDVDHGSMDSSTRSFPHIPDDSMERDSSRTTRVTTRTTTTTKTSGGEQIFHQKGDPEAGDKSCVIS